jgi:hypothetical protein
MKEKELVDIGFTKQVSTEDELYFFSYDIGEFTLISSADIESEYDEFNVEFFENESFIFFDATQLKNLIKILECNKK